jgi:hypothetical protein
MKYCIPAFLLLLGLSADVFAQVASVPAAATFEAFRKVGESRVWTFEVERQTIGSLTSTVKGKTEIDDVDGYVISQRLVLDFSKSGSELTMKADGEQYVSESGYYLGCKLDLTVNGQTSILEINRDGDRLEASVKGETGTTESAIPFPNSGFGYESFFVDLFELYFAMHGVAVEQTYADTLFSVQSMLPINFNASCLDYKWQGLFTGKFDSVFVVNVALPENYRLFLNKSHHLAKAEMPDRKLKIYLDYVGPARGSQRNQEPGFTLTGLLRALPVIAIYLAFAALVLVPLGWRGWRSRTSYMAFAAGNVAFILVPFVLHPLQKWAVDGIVIPGARRGESLFVLALLPALIAGVILTAIFTAAFISLKKTLTAESPRLSVTGAFFGAGFGLAESILLAATIPTGYFFSMMLVERSAFVVLYATIGALLGRAVQQDAHAIVQSAVASLLIITLFRYLPVLVQQRIVELNLMYVFALLMALVLLGVILIILARSNSRKRGGMTH